MKLVKIGVDTFINVEKVLGLTGGVYTDRTKILLQGDQKIEVEGSLYKVKKIIEDAMKEK